MVKYDNYKKKLKKKEVKSSEQNTTRKFSLKIMTLFSNKYKHSRPQEKNIWNSQESTKFWEMKKITLKKQNKDKPE